MRGESKGFKGGWVKFDSGVFTGMYHLLCVQLDEVQYFDPSTRLHTHIRTRIFSMLHALDSE